MGLKAQGSVMDWNEMAVEQGHSRDWHEMVATGEKSRAQVCSGLDRSKTPIADMNRQQSQGSNGLELAVAEWSAVSTNHWRQRD